MNSLRIGVNALYLIPAGVGGSEIYLRSLLLGLSQLETPHQFEVFTNAETSPDLVPRHPNWCEHRTGVRASIRPLRLLFEQTLLPFACSDLDVLFCPGFTAPALAPCHTVTTIHDLQHVRHGEYFRRLDLPFWRYFVWQAVRTSTRLIAVSDQTRTDVLRHYSIPETKVITVWHGVEQEFSAIAERRKRTCCEPIMLFPATTHLHKNHSRLLRAFRKFSLESPEWRLVLTGVMGYAHESVCAEVAALGIERSVDILGWLPRAQLYDWFERAAALLYPSLFEGFGLPVLEGLTAGVPTACSAIEPLLTIVGDAALLFDPYSESAILDGMRRITQDEELRCRLALAGPKQSARYGGNACAEATLRVLEQAVS